MSNPKDTVPMKAVECPICKGKGRVMNDVVKTKIKCHGCEGKGWVEVHYAQIGEAPKFIPQNIPYPNPYQDPRLNPVPYKKWGGGGSGGSSDPYWNNATGAGGGLMGITNASTFNDKGDDVKKLFKKLEEDK